LRKYSPEEEKYPEKILNNHPLFKKGFAFRRNTPVLPAEFPGTGVFPDLPLRW